MGTTNDQSIQKSFRQHLRRRSTQAELALWMNLRHRQLLGYKFRRQHGIGLYILDFYCPALRLAIEVDGASHESVEAKGNDKRRQLVLERLGVRFLRYTDDQVLGNISNVVAAIEGEIRKLTTNPKKDGTATNGYATTP
jgi:very-short-patch-repair endonuclease